MSDMLPNLESYFEKLVRPRDELLLELEAEAEREEIPIIGPLVGHLLYILAAFGNTGRILELGTASGYSAIFLGRACEPPGGKVITLEYDPDMASRARLNIEKAGLSHVVEVREGDALEMLSEMNDTFDMVFMDIDKVFYAPALADCRRLLRSGGLLVADNAGFADADAFNRLISSEEGWMTAHLLSYLPFHSPHHDALCFALRL